MLILRIAVKVSDLFLTLIDKLHKLDDDEAADKKKFIIAGYPVCIY